MGGLKNLRRKIGNRVERHRLKVSDFTIISNDCWGAEIYRNCKLKYNTPFVGLMLMAPCYIKLLADPKKIIEGPLHFIPVSRYEEQEKNRKEHGKNYPVGIIGDDIEIHFLHYESEEEAREKWSKRTQRINWNRVFYKLDASKDYCTIELLTEFDQLPLQNKLAIGKESNPDISSYFKIKDWEKDGAKMFIKTLRYFDVVNWIIRNNGKPGILHKLNYWFFLRNTD